MDSFWILFGYVLDYVWTIFGYFVIFWKKSSFLLGDSLQSVKREGHSVLQKIYKNCFFLQLNCIGESGVDLIIVDGCVSVSRMFFISIKFAKNEKKVIWNSKKSPCKFCQKALFEGGDMGHVQKELSKLTLAVCCFRQF